MSAQVLFTANFETGKTYCLMSYDNTSNWSNPNSSVLIGFTDGVSQLTSPFSTRNRMLGPQHGPFTILFGKRSRWTHACVQQAIEYKCLVLFLIKEKSPFVFDVSSTIKTTLSNNTIRVTPFSFGIGSDNGYDETYLHLFLLTPLATSIICITVVTLTIGISGFRMQKNNDNQRSIKTKRN